jgi:OOP family OmpA-OmpF porin
MKQHMHKSIVLLAGAVLSTAPLFAQDSSYTGTAAVDHVKPFTGSTGFRTWSIGINGGALAPVVGIGGSNDFTKWKPTIGYGAYVKYQILHAFGVQAEFLKGTLKATNEKKLGNDMPPQSPYASFKTDINWAGSISGVVTLANINWLHKQSLLMPYVSLGAGLISYDPKLVATGTTTEVRYKPDGHIKEFFVPVGAGIKLNVSPGVNIDLGYRMNFVDGDNLDGYYKGPSKDKFSYGHIGVEFALGKKTKPQLAAHNPAAELAREMHAENEALKASLAASEQRTEQQLSQIGALQNELNKMKQDSDGDGVSDIFDKCPGTPAGEKVDGAGCPLPKPDTLKEEKIVVTEEDRRIVNEAIRNLEFDFGKATIRSKSYASLNRVAEILVKKHFSLKLAGHTDNVGSDAANLKLSKDRAESVKSYLVSQGANPSRIEAIGYGESQPIASNKTAEGRQKNRRVEFTLY